MLLTRGNLKIKTPPVAVKVSGGGFGSAERNRLVEQAACKAVRKRYEQRKYEVVSREKENLGYDFDATRNSEKLHLEVKGVSGSLLKFPITANEVARARSDSKFQLVVVTETTLSTRKIHIYSRKEFLKLFDLKPFAYFAEVKRSLPA